MSIVHVLYRAILLVRIGLFGEACSPLRAVRVHLEKYTERFALWAYIWKNTLGWLAADGRGSRARQTSLRSTYWVTCPNRWSPHGHPDLRTADRRRS